MDDTPHHLSHKTSATPPPLSRMADLNTSHYYVVQISEYDAMKAEIERLRAELNNQAFITETLRNHQPQRDQQRAVYNLPKQ